MTVKRNLDEEQAWRLLEKRDRQASFFYGVRTTGVFCRPWCASRRPRRENVRFFATYEEALRAGFRACLRCKPERDAEYPVAQPVVRMVAYLEENRERVVTLAELGERSGMSPFTVQRVFQRAMGVSPAAYQRALKAGAFRRGLKEGSDVTSAVYEAGYGAASRAYEAGGLGMAPARFAAGGKGERIGFAVAEAALGWVIAGATERGLCWLALAGSRAEVIAGLEEEFPAAEMVEEGALRETLDAVVRSVEAGGKLDLPRDLALALPLDLRGTAFQLRVWQALRRIPRGETLSYGALAAEMGIPRSVRAVARACAVNRVAIVVPCHRVVGSDGGLTGYRWGVERKRRLLEVEGASGKR